MIHAFKILTLVFIAFVPVWCGGQAMTCYNQGHLWRSVACVAIATSMNIGLVLFGMAYVQYSWSFVTILKFFH